MDVWSIGCIFAEMVQRQPLFPGDSEIDEIFRIFRLLGTPDDDVWPGVSSLPDYKSTFPQWSPKEVRTAVAGLNSVTADLLEVRTCRASYEMARLALKLMYLGLLALVTLQSMLVYDPAKRISAKMSLQHEYFRTQVK